MLRTIYTSNIALLANSVYFSRILRTGSNSRISWPYPYKTGAPYFPNRRTNIIGLCSWIDWILCGMIVIRIYRDSRLSAWSYCALKRPLLAASRCSRTKRIIFINSLSARVTIEYISHASSGKSQGVRLVSFPFVSSQSLWYITLNTTKSAPWFKWIRSSELLLCITFTDTEYDRRKHSLLRSRYLYAHHNGAWYCYGRLDICMRSHECYASFSLLNAIILT